MDNAGAVVGPLVATGLVALGLTLRGVFWIAVVPGAIATVLVLFVKEGARPGAGAGVGVGAIAAPRVLTRKVTSYLAILALFSLANSSDGFLLLRARSLGLGTAQIPILWAALNASKVLWAWVGGSLADRMKRPRLIAAGWFVYALVYLGLGVATAAWHVWAIFIVYGVFFGLTEPVEKALVKDLVLPEQRGRAYGAYNFVVGITALPAGLLTGELWERWGAGPALEMGAALAAAAGVGLLVWERAVGVKRA
jgi:MFS family permease